MVSIVEEKLRPLPTVRVPATVGAVLIVVRNTIGITVVAAFVDLPLIVKFKSPKLGNTSAPTPTPARSCVSQTVSQRSRVQVGRR
jgi:hypothetical protein